MDANNLIRSANKIGDFFESFPDRAEALTGIANHIVKFWEPRMRKQFFAHLDSQHKTQTDSGLSPILSATIEAHRAMLEPKA